MSCMLNIHSLYEAAKQVVGRLYVAMYIAQFEYS